MLRKYKGRLDSIYEILMTTPLISMDIDPGDNPPVSQGPYPLATKTP